jgi:hypothetical protein
MVDAELTNGGCSARQGRSWNEQPRRGPPQRGFAQRHPLGGCGVRRVRAKRQTRRGFVSERRNCRGSHYRKFRCAAILHKRLECPLNSAKAARQQGLLGVVTLPVLSRPRASRRGSCSQTRAPTGGGRGLRQPQGLGVPARRGRANAIRHSLTRRIGRPRHAKLGRGRIRQARGDVLGVWG